MWNARYHSCKFRYTAKYNRGNTIQLTQLINFKVKYFLVYRTYFNCSTLNLAVHPRSNHTEARKANVSVEKEPRRFYTTLFTQGHLFHYFSNFHGSSVKYLIRKYLSRKYRSC